MTKHEKLSRRRTAALRARTALLVVMSSLVTAPAAADDETRAAIPIYNPIVLTPPATSGLGLAPEVEARIAIDERGRVTGVEVLSVTPSSELDDAYREAVEGTVLEWRYAPALENGQPVASSRKLSLQFRAREPSERTPLPRRAQGSATLALLASDDVDLVRARIFTKTEQEQRQRLEELAETAEKKLDPAFRRRNETSRFVVISDTPTPEAGQTLADNLEASFEALDTLLGSRFELQPHAYKIVVYLYRDFSALASLWQELGTSESAAGLYRAPGFIAGYAGSAQGAHLVQLLLHEATHAYVDRHLRRPGAALPRWLGEGFAEYVARSRIKKGKLVPGAELGSRFAVGSGLGARQKQLTGVALKRAKELLLDERALSLQQVLAADAACFAAGQAEAYYALSWLLVHFLRHGEEGWAEDEFPRLLLYAAEGYPSREVIEAVYGMTPRELEPRFERYVRGL